MTAEEMLYECKVGFDAMTNLSNPGFEKKEWSTFLTQSQEELIKQRLNPKGNKYREVIEETEKRAIDFAELVKSADLTLSADQSGVHDITNLTGYFFDLPSDFFYCIEEKVRTSQLDCSVTSSNSYLVVRVKPVNHGYVMANYRNPFKKPYVDRTEGLAWRLKYQRENSDFTVSSGYNYSHPQKHEILTDGTFSVDIYSIRYLRQPKPIIIQDTLDTSTLRGYAINTASIHCELSESVHPEIVAGAIKKAAASVMEDKRYQIGNIESLKTE